MNNDIYCRVCLETQPPMLNTVNSQLQRIFETVTGVKMVSDGRSLLLCMLCHSHLKKTFKFIQRAHHSEEYLLSLTNGSELSNETLLKKVETNRLCASKVEFSHSCEECIYERQSVMKEENLNNDTVKQETNNPSKDENKIEFDTGVTLDTAQDNTDSEDELLIKIKDRKRQQTVRVRKKVKKAKKEIIEKGRKGLTDLTKEVFVSKEEQFHELVIRSQSKQYLEAAYKCGLCYKGFLDATTFDNHQKKHDIRSGEHECDVCRLRYSSAAQLNSHVKSSHSRRYECQKCQQVYHTAFQARDHEKWHNGFLYTCQICGHESKTSSTHLTHKRKCYPDARFACDVCGANFVAKFGLTLHKSKAHKFDDIQHVGNTDSQPERTCVLCKTVFLSKNVFEKHLFTCKKSIIQFNTDNNCPVCKQYLPDKTLLQHLKESHSDEKERSVKKDTSTHTCDECKSVFKSRVVLAAHVKSVHLGIKYNKNVVCEHCGKKFRSHAQLRYHQRSHSGEKPFACAECGRRFPLRAQLAVHARRHSGERPYRCALCRRAFSQKPALNRHLRVHTGAKPYSCDYCSKAFSQSGSLRGHVNQVHLKIPYRRRASRETALPH